VFPGVVYCTPTKLVSIVSLLSIRWQSFSVCESDHNYLIIFVILQVRHNLVHGVVNENRWSIKSVA